MSSSQLQSTTARSVLCRGSLVRLPLVSRRNRSSEPVRRADRGHGAQPGRGEFDRQRYPIQRPADARHRRQRWASTARSLRTAARPGLAATGRLGRTRSHRGWRPHSGRASGSTRHSASPVMPSSSLLVARIRSPCGTPRASGGRTPPPTRSRARSCPELAAPPARGSRRPGRSVGPRRSVLAEQRIPEPERGERRLRHVTVRADRRQFHQPGPVRQAAEQRARSFRGQPGLYEPPWPDHGGEPMFGDEFADRGGHRRPCRRSWSARRASWSSGPLPTGAAPAVPTRPAAARRAMRTAPVRRFRRPAHRPGLLSCAGTRAAPRCRGQVATGGAHQRSDKPFPHRMMLRPPGRSVPVTKPLRTVAEGDLRVEPILHGCRP